MTPVHGDRRRRAAGRRLVALAVTLLAAQATALLAGEHWVAELFSHFVPHYAVAAALLAGALAWARRPRWAAGCALLLAVNAWTLLDAAPPPVAGRSGDLAVASPGEAAGHRIRLLHWNVDAANPDPDAALAWILERELLLDVVVLLEVSGSWQRALDTLSRFYPVSEVLLRDDPFGIAVFTRLPGSGLRVLTRASGLSSVLLTASTAGGAPVAVWALHPPPPFNRELANERNAQLVSIARTTRTAPLPIAVVGDLNVTPWSPWFRRLLEAGGLVDLAGGPQRPTWAPGAVPVALGLPLDHSLATPGIRLAHRSLGPRLGSDHRPVLVHLDVLADDGPE